MDVPSRTVVEPALFPGAAVAVSLQALIDNTEFTIVFVCEAREPTTGRLVGLWSSSPQPVELYEDAHREAVRQFTSMVWANTGPFP